MVILLHQIHHQSLTTDPCTSKIHMYRPSTRTTVDLMSLSNTAPTRVLRLIIVVHAMSGCDTVSGIFRDGDGYQTPSPGYNEVCPPSILTVVSCGCQTKKGCKAMACSCKKVGGVCTDFCSCEGCENQPSEAPETAISASISDADDCLANAEADDEHDFEHYDL